MSSQYNKKLYLIVTVLILSLLLAACGSDKDDEKEADNTPKTEITMQFAWIHTIEYAGFYSKLR